MSRKKTAVKILWILFSINVFVGFVYVSSFFIPTTPTSLRPVLFYFLTTLTLILTFLHAQYLLGTKRATVFLLLAAAVGFAAEIISLRYSTLFGGNYIYEPDGLMIANVPAMVPVYWAIFIYMGYTFASSFLVWVNKKKPRARSHNMSMLALLIFLDGAIVTSIDLVMEPIKILEGSWQWMDGGSYFGAPIGNFIGWFIVTIIVTGSFRLYEYYRPYSRKTNKSLYVMMQVGFLIVIINFALAAIQYQIFELALISFFIVAPIAAVNTMLYIRYRKKKTIINKFVY